MLWLVCVTASVERHNPVSCLKQEAICQANTSCSPSVQRSELKSQEWWWRLFLSSVWQENNYLETNECAWMRIFREQEKEKQIVPEGRGNSSFRPRRLCLGWTAIKHAARGGAMSLIRVMSGFPIEVCAFYPFSNLRHISQNLLQH